METKKWEDSYTKIERLVLPADTNIFNALYGGRLVEWIDNVASIVAIKHARRRAVTGSIDSLYFLSPIHIADIVKMEGRVNYVTRTTMEIEVDVNSQEGLTGTERFTTKAYLTYVAVDQDGRPTAIPSLSVETDDEKRRFTEGEARSKIRLDGLAKIKREMSLARTDS
ncbi:MAG: acyl-CoA thioesterase [Candidatus Thermoplasmatota archaeon]|jgi:acyl-CoA hydrolase|nr:acyl-CoA thioesterase [Candidatus Thermoplasmatota archaeon]